MQIIIFNANYISADVSMECAASTRLSVCLSVCYIWVLFQNDVTYVTYCVFVGSAVKEPVAYIN